MNLVLEYLPRDDRVLRRVAAWIDREWAHLNPGRTFGQVVRRLKRRAGSREVPLTLVARVDGRMVGTASLLWSDMDGLYEPGAWLSAVYVTPEYRRRGIGDALCHRVEAEAARLKQSELLLFTEDRERFYAKRGWVVARRPRYRGRDVVVMRKSLAADS